MSYYASKYDKGILVEKVKIQKNTINLYLNSGYVVSKEGNDQDQEDHDPYDYYDVSENRLEPIVINGESFDGYSSFFCINTKTYVEEPTRTLNGSIPNINDYATFIVPRVQVSFDYMTIQDFRRFLRAITPNEFPVTYYDYELNRIVTRMMYIEPREMATLYNKGYEILAITGEKISLIGTLNDTDFKYIKYYDNVTYKTINSQSKEEGYIELDEKEILLGNWYYINNGNKYTHNKLENDSKVYTFKSWNTKPDGTGTTYNSLQLIQGLDNLELYAQWDESGS